MFFVVAWKEFRARRTASLIKEVCCASCHSDYYYVMTRTIDARGCSLYGLADEKARQKAEDNAAAAIERALNLDFEVVACPSCGCLQPNMIARIRKAYRRQLWTTGFVLLATGIALPAMILCCMLWSCFEQARPLSQIDLEVLWFIVPTGLIAAIVGLFLLLFRQHSLKEHDLLGSEDTKLLLQSGPRAFSRTQLESVSRELQQGRSANEPELLQ
jgi:hypothetical protein